MTRSHSGPFRSYPWPLNHVRKGLHLLRLQRFRMRRGSGVIYGDSVSLAKNADIRSPHWFVLGNNVSIGKNFTCEVDLRVGNHVLISSNVSIVGRDHPFDDPSVTVFEAPRVDDCSVEIGSDVLLGFGSVVVGTVTIADGCIVGAGSVVVHDLPAYTVCGGVPAKPIRPRYNG